MAISDYRGSGTQGGDALQQALARGGKSFETYLPQVSGYVDDFAAQFKQLVGREPNANETSSYIGNVLAGSGFDAFTNNRGLELQQLGQNFIGTRYADEADYFTQQKLQGQQAESARLSDLFRQQGNQAINDTEASLLEYQNKLFERLRPNLITSLQSQGLLNSGGLNQAVAGAQSDLATAGAEELRGLRFANEQGANQIAFAGQAAPYEFAQQQIMNRPLNLQNAAQTGLQNAYGTFMNQLNFQNQQSLMNQQYQLNQMLRGGGKGGFFNQLGSALAPSLGSALGTSLGAWALPQSSGGGKTTQGASLAALSSRKAKKDITKLSEAEEDALYARMIEMPLNRWRYKTESSDSPRHLGVMTDEAVPEIVMADGEHLSVVDYLGVLTLALKVQERRFKKVA